MFKPTCYYYKRKSCLHSTMAVAGIIISVLGMAALVYLFLSCGCCKKLKNKMKKKADQLMNCCDDEQHCESECCEGE